jgi:hypothetical protein
MMDAVGVAIASLLPEDYRGAYGDCVDGLDDAREIAGELIGTQAALKGPPHESQ